MTGKIYKSILFTKLYFFGETSPHKLSIQQFLIKYIEVYKTKRIFNKYSIKLIKVIITKDMLNI